MTDKDIKIFHEYFTTGKSVHQIAYENDLTDEKTYTIAMNMFKYMKSRLKRGFECEWKLKVKE